MKKYFMIFFSLCTAMIFFTSCGKEVKQTKGLIKELTPTSLVLAVDGDDELKLDMMDDVRYSNGAVMVNDTVIVTYVSSYKENKAAVIQLVPRTSEIVNLGHNDNQELKTSDANQPKDSIQ